MKLSWARLSIVALVIAYVGVFTVAYAKLVVPWFGYFGQDYIVPSSEYLWFLRALAILPSVWMPVALRRPSQVAYWLLYLFVLIPIDFVPIYSRIVNTGDFLVFVSVATASFAVMGLGYQVRLARSLQFAVNPRVYWMALLAIAVLFIAILFATTGFHPRLVGLTNEVYDVRANYAAETARENRLIPYAISWQGNVINPMFMAHGIVRRRAWMIAIGVLGQLALYSITAYKNMLLSGIGFLGILFAIRLSGTTFGRRLTSGIIVALTAAIMAYELRLVTGPDVAGTVERIISIPGLLTGYYFDFFSHHAKAFLGDGWLKPFVDYRYPYDVPHLIGDAYFHNPRIDANANIWADAYANFGYVGLGGLSVLLAAVFWIYDSIAKNIDLRIAALMITIPAMQLSNCGLQTALVTHGLLACIAVLFMYPHRSANSGESREAHALPKRMDTGAAAAQATARGA